MMLGLNVRPHTVRIKPVLNAEVSMNKLPYDEDDEAYFESLAEKILLEREQLEVTQLLEKMVESEHD